MSKCLLSVFWLKLLSRNQCNDNDNVTDVRSLKEKWEGNGKGIHEGSGQGCGNGKGTGNLPMKKIADVIRHLFFENR